MRNLDDAVAICQREQDNFYVTAFMLEAWLGEVTYRIVEEIAGKKKATKRSFQTGAAREVFDQTFGHASDEDTHHLFQSVLRVLDYDDPQSSTLRHAFWVTSREIPIADWMRKSTPITAQALAAFQWDVLHRICDWVDAFIHARMHAFSHHAPVVFDPDPEKRDLALLGFQQRRFHEMSEFQRTWWQWHHGEAADRLSDPANWSMVGRGLTSETTTHQTYPALDEAVILFWPLVIRNRWTYRDLMNVLRSVAPSPLSYPCDREQNLASHCANVLGLRKGGPKGKTTTEGLPPGSEIASALCGKTSLS